MKGAFGGGRNRIAVGHVEFDHDAAFGVGHHQQTLLHGPLAERFSNLLDLKGNGENTTRMRCNMNRKVL